MSQTNSATFTGMKNMRLDVYLSKSGMVCSREAAKKLVLEGAVTVNGVCVSKPSLKVEDNDSIEVVGELPKYVSRGGLKLEKALNCFHINIGNMHCLDIGASTGGFTDCLLQNGAKIVYAVDVGHDQLHPSLRNDPRVCCMEGVNVKSLTPLDFPEELDFICTDVSFISLKHVIPVLAQLLPSEKKAVVLIKPQFECGRSDIGKNGIVRAEKVQLRVINEIIYEFTLNGFIISGLDYSPISGSDGNIEFLLCAVKEGISDSCCVAADVNPAKTVRAAHEALR